MTTRRQFIKIAGTALAGSACFPMCTKQSVVNKELPVPTPAQIEWQDYEIGLIYHFDMPVAAGDFSSNNTARKTFNPQFYNPIYLDTDQWIEAAVAVGAKYAILTATHFNGFMQWQSDLYPYGVKQAAWRNGKGDVVKDFVESCHKAGIKPGLYLSTHRNVYWQVWGHYVDWGKGKGTPQQEKFNRVAEKMVKELCSNYGELCHIWFDAGVKTPAEGGPDVLPIFEKYQPHSVFYHNRDRSDFRWIGNEQGYADDPCWAAMPLGEDGQVSHNHPEWKPLLGSGDPNGKVWSPGMVDVPFRGHNGIHNWFWAPDQDHAIYPLDTLMDMYYKSVGRNCNLVIGEVVDRQGRVPQCDIDRLAAFGSEIKKRFGQPAAETRGDGTLLELQMDTVKEIEHIIIMEDIRYGERIRKYQIDGLSPNGRWEPLFSGQSVGHKRIIRTAPQKLSRVRLVIEQAAAKPVIKSFAVFAS